MLSETLISDKYQPGLVRRVWIPKSGGGNRHFLGFSITPNDETAEVNLELSKRSHQRIYAKIKELTPRNWGGTIEACIQRINSYLKGWVGFFRLTTNKWVLSKIDAHIRRRLRAIQLKQWKRKRTIVKKLIQLGAKPRAAWTRVYRGVTSLWKLSHTPIVDKTLRNVYFTDRGLLSLVELWTKLQPNRQCVSG